jgi:hypothetical protein
VTSEELQRKLARLELELLAASESLAAALAKAAFYEERWRDLIAAIDEAAHILNEAAATASKQVEVP